MQIARVMASYTLGEADILRKAMSKKKKDLILEEQEKFKARALKNGYDIKLIEKVFSSMLKFAEYGFNKSHSIGYSIVAYKMAYLKAHYRKNFISYLLSMDINDENKTKIYIYEARQNGINILKPDINLSFNQYIIEPNGIRYPLTNIKNVGLACCDIILKERENGKFTDIYDFISRCYGKSVNSKTLESLIYSSAFECFGYNKRTLIENLDNIINYSELIRELSREYSLEPEIKIKEEYTKSYLMEKELDVFGFYLTENPITLFKSKIGNIVNINEIESYFDKIVSIIVYIDKLKETNTKKDEVMCFISGSDEIAKVDIVLFPSIYKENKDLKKGDIILVKGRVEKRFDIYQVVANMINKL